LGFRWDLGFGIWDFVPVQHTVLVGVVKGFGEFHRDFRGPFWPNRVLVDHPVEGLAFHVMHGEVVDLPLNADVMDRNDIRMVAECGESA
jgi:hypothetical protein